MNKERLSTVLNTTSSLISSRILINFYNIAASASLPPHREMWSPNNVYNISEYKFLTTLPKHIPTRRRHYIMIRFWILNMCINISHNTSYLRARRLRLVLPLPKTNDNICQRVCISPTTLIHWESRVWEGVEYVFIAIGKFMHVAHLSLAKKILVNFN